MAPQTNPAIAFKRFLKDKKTSLKISDTKLSRASGVGRSTITMIKSGAQKGPTLENAIKIIYGLGSTLAEFEKYMEENKDVE